MAIKKIVKIWDDEKILKENINFLKTKTKPVTFPASDYIKNIIRRYITDQRRSDLVHTDTISSTSVAVDDRKNKIV